MKVTPLTPAIGAWIDGLDLSRPLDEPTLRALRTVWLERLVVVIRGQSLDPGQQLAFAEQIGRPDIYPFLDGLPGYPAITEVLKREHETANFGGVWHSDTTYQRCPPMATMLLARELPPLGGDTLFANQYLALESLSEGLRATLAGLRGVSSAGQKAVAATRRARIDEQGRPDTSDQLVAVHPVLRRHPETGRTSLFINRAHTARFEGWTEEESQPLLAFLFARQVQPEFICRVRWAIGDLALWDNRCCLHYPVNDYYGHRRLLHRITLKGDEPLGP